MEVYRGDAVPSEPVGPEFLGWATSGSVRGYGVGASSGNCVAVETPHGQITPTTTITQTSRLTCRFNTDITITVDDLSKTSQRLRIELPNTKVAVDAALTRNGSHLTYATRYCAPKPVP